MPGRYRLGSWVSRGVWSLTLLVACTFTLWAVLGELSAGALLTWELVGGGTSGWVGVACFATVGALALRYFVLSTTDMVTRAWDTPPPVAEKTPAESVVPSHGPGQGRVLLEPQRRCLLRMECAQVRVPVMDEKRYPCLRFASIA